LISRKDAEIGSSGSDIDIDKATTSSDEEMLTGVKVDEDKSGLVQGSFITLPTESVLPVG